MLRIIFTDHSSSCSLEANPPSAHCDDFFPQMTRILGQCFEKSKPSLVVKHFLRAEESSELCPLPQERSVAYAICKIYTIHREGSDLKIVQLVKN